MGRSRAASRPTPEDDLNHRSKRKKTTPGAENGETGAAGQILGEMKAGLYVCNYCNKELSGMVRIKCAVCTDFDLCVECYSIGAEVTPHKSNHPYRVMDNLSFPLLCIDWNVDEEISLLEGIEMYGFGNWTEVAELVGSKNKSQCIDHYNAIYMNSPLFPLPDMSRVMAKSREELLAIGKRHEEVKKESSILPQASFKNESPVSSKVKYEAQSNEDLACQSSSSFKEEVDPHISSSSGTNFSGAVKKTTKVTKINDNIKAEENQSDRRIGEKKPRVSMDEGPSITELGGFNFKRQEFEVEYDNDAEQLLADMEFRDNDTDAERQLKLRVLHIYSKRLDERKRRKEFILERNLLYPDPFEKNLSPEEKEIYQRVKVFMRFHSKEEHEELLKSLIEEHRIAQRIQDLQEARAAGCRTALEANKFIELKRKKEAEENAAKIKENTLAGTSGKGLMLGTSPRGIVRGSTDVLHPFSKDSSNATEQVKISNPLDEWDITGFIGADLLSENEKQLCVEIRILPSHYLKMLQMLSVEIIKGNITQKSDAYNLFKVESSKVDKIYDMLVEKGIAKA